MDRDRVQKKTGWSHWGAWGEAGVFLGEYYRPRVLAKGATPSSEHCECPRALPGEHVCARAICVGPLGRAATRGRLWGGFAVSFSEVSGAPCWSHQGRVYRPASQLLFWYS